MAATEQRNLLYCLDLYQARPRNEHANNNE